jgi:predicted GNAT family acetyltransferase
VKHVAVARNPQTSRYEARLDGQFVGLIDYFAGAGVIDLIHTEVLPEFADRGIASTLVRHALDDIRAQSMQVIPTCEYVQSWIERHPAYANLVILHTAG